MIERLIEIRDGERFAAGGPEKLGELGDLIKAVGELIAKAKAMPVSSAPEK